MVLTFLSGVFTAVFIGVITPLVIDRFSITEPRLVNVGEDVPGVTILQAKGSDRLLEVHARSAVRVKNYGFRSGHIDRVEVVEDGLRDLPMNLKVLHVDKTDIGWLEEKDIAFEFIAQMTPFPEKHKNFHLKTYYYGPGGDEILAMGLVLLLTNNSVPEPKNITGEVCIRERISREIKCGEIAIK